MNYAKSEEASVMKAPLTPFRRNRSRVFYLSEDEDLRLTPERCTPVGITDSLQSQQINVSLSNLGNSRVDSKSLPSCVISEEVEDVVTSADEDPGNTCPEECSSICSPAASWRGSDRSSHSSWRGSPSQRSQDSGYSDSGESNAGGAQADEGRSQPQVKHITRVYVGEYQQSVNESTQTETSLEGNQGVTCNSSDSRHSTTNEANEFENRITIVSCGAQQNELVKSSTLVPKVPKRRSFSTPRYFKAARRRSRNTYNTSYKALPSSEPPLHCNSLEKGLPRQNLTAVTSPTTSPLNLDETSTQLEHKSLSCISLPTPLSKTLLSGGVCGNRRSSISFGNNSLGTFSDGASVSNKLSRNKFVNGKVSYDKQSRDNLANGNLACDRLSCRHSRKISNGKMVTKSCSSEDNLGVVASDLKPRRQEPLKARRRWSAADLDKCVRASRSGPVTGQQLPLLTRDKDHIPASPETRTSTPILSRKTVSIGSPASPLAIADNLGNDSLNQWLCDLSRLCESECMNTLQSKSLHSEHPTPAAAFTYAQLANIQKRAHVVSAEFALLCLRLEHLQLRQVPFLVKSLVCCVLEFIEEHAKTEDSPSKSKSSLSHQFLVVNQICDSLSKICSQQTPQLIPFTSEEEEEEDNERGENTGVKDRFKDEGEEERRSGSEVKVLNNGHVDREKIRELVQIVTALGHAFTKLVDLLLSQGLKSLVRILEEELHEREVESALSKITALGVNTGHVCKLIGRVGGIRALLGICVEPRLRKLRATALRALATVCCVAESIQVFEKEGGVDVISEVLCDPKCHEEERAEAAGVLAQITSPWVEDNDSLPQLHNHVRPLTASLTDLAESTTSPEVFLLTSAALANLTFLDSSCVDALLESSTHQVLLKEIQTQETLSVFTKDQIATVLANMSSSPVAAEEVVSAGGIRVLVSLLKSEPRDVHRLPEIAATERVQQKSAIALSRLSTDSEAANQVIAEGGASRLVYLCKNEKARNHSDAVLVACLAALRKLATSCGVEVLKSVDASELIEPRLLDSFLIYSSQQESYV